MVENNARLSLAGLIQEAAEARFIWWFYVDRPAGRNIEVLYEGRSGELTIAVLYAGDRHQPRAVAIDISCDDSRGACFTSDPHIIAGTLNNSVLCGWERLIDAIVPYEHDRLAETSHEAAAFRQQLRNLVAIALEPTH